MVVNPAQRMRDRIINAWRDGSTLDLTLHTAEPHTQRYHLAELFSTPIQPQFDECLALTPPNLVHTPGAIAQVDEGQLTYRSGAILGNDVASTSVGHGDTQRRCAQPGPATAAPSQ